MIRIDELTETDDRMSEQLQQLLLKLMPDGRIDRERLERMIADPRTVLFTARVDGQVAGMLTLALYDTLAARRGWVEDVVVDEAFRHRGVGRALVRAALERSREQGVDTLSLTSAAHRTAARALYRSEGFRVVDTTLFRRIERKNQ